MGQMTIHRLLIIYPFSWRFLMCDGSLLVDAEKAAKLLSISLAHLFALKKTGRFGPTPIHMGRSVRYSCHELQAWSEAGSPPANKWAVQKSVSKSR
jgi:predicted DNA-binding transcriptional regulator AlpA